MGIINKIDNIGIANVAKVNNIAKAGLSKITGITVQSAAYTSANSVFFDNTNDYGVINGCTLPTDAGSVSFWLKLGQTMGTDIILHWSDLSTSGGFTNGFIDVRLQNNSGNPAARNIVFTYSDGSSGGRGCSIKSSTSDHGTGFSRWKGNYDGVYSSYWPKFEYNANKLIEPGTHTYNPAEGGEHGWHHFVITWDVNETYVGKDAQSSHKFRPTAAHDGTTTTHTGTMRIYMDGVLRNFGQSLYPSHNYQRTPTGMDEISSNSLSEIGVMGRPNNTYPTAGNMDDLACFNAKLSDAAVTAMYNSGAPTDLTSNSGNYTYSSNLIGYWKFDEGSGTTIADSSTNNNSMTLYNSPTWDNGDAP
tara:strand:- start:1660 stop:2742 length:1083 start_codon:yes stop_codon:yes gene_type:complete